MFSHCNVHFILYFLGIHAVKLQETQPDGCTIESPWEDTLFPIRTSIISSVIPALIVMDREIKGDST